jgi:predicted alpha/beta-hydrolase family hydrolase
MDQVKVPGVFGTSFEPDGDAVGTAVLVPGRGYPPMAPLLFFTGLALLQHGWRVEHHWWDPPRHESDEQTLAWVRQEVEGALPETGRTLVVGKSLGTWAAPLAAERGLAAIWLTPILTLPDLADAIAANSAPQLLLGGSADDFWDSVVARELEGPTRTVVEVPDADHILLARGDVVRGVEMHVEVARAVDEWLGRLAAPQSTSRAP